MKRVVQLLFGLMVFAWVNQASAATFSTRFGKVATNVGIGVANGRVYVVEQRISDGSCQNQIISSQSGLTENVTFFAGNGGNRVRIAMGGWPVNLCGFTLTNLRSKNFILKIDAGDGDDVVIVEQNSSAQGGAGNDIILAYDTIEWSTGRGRLWGDSGNDYIIQAGGFGKHDALIGGLGNDHLCDLGDGSEIYGDDGFDYWWNWTVTIEKVEQQIASGEDCNNMASAVLFTQSF